MGDSISVSRSESNRVPVADNNQGANDMNSMERNKIECFVSGENGLKSFFQIVKERTPYSPLFQTSAMFEVYINNQGTHWYLLVKLEGSDLPFITFEIVSTTKGTTPAAMVCIQPDDEAMERACVSQNTTMEDICSTADTIRKQMGKYDPVLCNSQQFCNAILRSFNSARSFPTTIGPQLPNNGLEELDPPSAAAARPNNDVKCDDGKNYEGPRDFDNAEIVRNKIQERMGSNCGM